MPRQRPTKPDSDAHVHVVIPRALWGRTKEAATTEGRPAADVIREALERYLSRRKGGKKR